MRKTIVRAGVVGTAIASVTAFGVASAAWDASNPGATANSQVKGKGVSKVVLSVSDPASAQLYPGASGDLTFTLTNNNPFKVRVTGFGAGSAGVAGITSPVDGCSGSATGIGYALSTAQTTLPTTPATGQVAPFDVADGGSVTVTLVGAVTMSNDSADTCSGGVTFSVPVAATAASDAGSATTPSTGSISVGR